MGAIKMPSKAQVKQKRVKQNPMGEQETQEISSMFNQLVGTENISITDSYEIYVRMADRLQRIRDCLSYLWQARLFAQQYQKQIGDFIEQINTDLHQYFSMEFDAQSVINEEEVDKDTRDDYTNKFSGGRTCTSVVRIINSAQNIDEYRQAVKEENTEFIRNITGDFKPLEFCDINLKLYFVERDPQPAAKQMVVLVLHKVHEYGYELYDDARRPPINKEKLASIIKNAIAEAKKHGEIGHCKKAFDQIEKSVDMFADNFSDYYKDFIESKNPTVMMQNFVLDVSKKPGMDMETVGQLRKIISYYRRLSQHNNIQDPQLRQMMEYAENHFQRIDDHLKQQEN